MVNYYISYFTVLFVSSKEAYIKKLINIYIFFLNLLKTGCSRRAVWSVGDRSVQSGG